MDPDLSASDEEAAAMAAMLGFASFGGKPPAKKKRKFNASTDAYVEGQVLESLDKGGKKGQGSGGNQTKLGKQRVFGTKSAGMSADNAPKSNQDEIELGDEEEEDSRSGNARLAQSNEDEGPRYWDTSLPAPIDTNEREMGGEEEGGPAYMDTSTAAPILTDSISAAEAAEVQSRIDALLNSLSAPLPPPSNDPAAPPEYKASVSVLPSPGKNLPNRPAFAVGGGGGGGGGSEAGSVVSGASSWGGRSRGGPGGNWAGGGRGGAGGGPDDRWYEGYYDPSFNCNPWEKEEQKRGLQPVGTWLEHQGYSQGRR